MCHAHPPPGYCCGPERGAKGASVGILMGRRVAVSGRSPAVSGPPDTLPKWPPGHRAARGVEHHPRPNKGFPRNWPFIMPKKTISFNFIRQLSSTSSQSIALCGIFFMCGIFFHTSYLVIQNSMSCTSKNQFGAGVLLSL